MALLAATINKTLQRSACWRSTIDSHSSQVQTQPQKPSFHLVTTLLATFSGYFWFHFWLLKPVVAAEDTVSERNSPGSLATHKKSRQHLTLPQSPLWSRGDPGEGRERFCCEDVLDHISHPHRRPRLCGVSAPFIGNFRRKERTHYDKLSRPRSLDAYSRAHGSPFLT